jgi:hypothetical protein
VTNATWQDFWLNEGWTTYAETRITEILEGKESADLNAVYDEKRTYEIMERVGNDSPSTRLKLPSDNSDADSMTTVIAYTKGCFFLKECEYAVGRERFDAFIQTYIKRFQFQSLTTEQFLDFLKAELPEVFEKVDVQTWVYQPGMPEAWHKPQSHLYDEVQNVLDDYKNGKRPTREQVKDWHRYQILSFLQGLPKSMPVEDCKYFRDVLELDRRNDDSFFSYYYAICIRSGYQEILPEVERYIEKIGRLLYLFPILRALTQTDWTRNQARSLLQRTREKHHPVMINTTEGILKKAGL